MECRPDGGAGIPDPANDLPRGYFPADRDKDFGGMGVQRVEAATVIQYSTLAVPVEPAHVVDARLGNGRDGGPERDRDVDSTIIGLGAEAGIFLVPEPPDDPAGHRPGQPAPVLGEIAEEGHHPARGPAFGREASLLQLPDQGLDSLARPLELRRGLLVRLSFPPDLHEELTPLLRELLLDAPLPFGLALQPVELPLPLFEPCLRVLDLHAVRLRQHQLISVLAGDLGEEIGAVDEVRKGPRREKVFEVAASPALVDLAEAPGEAPAIPFELNRRARKLRGRASKIRRDDPPPALERGHVTDREGELNLFLLQIAEQIPLAASELLRFGPALLELPAERVQLPFLVLDLGLGLVDHPLRRVGGRRGGRDPGGR